MPKMTINGADGKLDGRYVHVQEAPAALFLAPHPYYGGTMDNKVLYTLYHTFARHGFSCLRFNFRSVGKPAPDGPIGGEEELADATTAFNWLQQRHLDHPIYVVGFSFGAWIAMQLAMRRPEVDHFVIVAPPVGMLDFNFLSPCPISGLIVQGKNDRLVLEIDTRAFAQRLNKQKDVDIAYACLTKADHFFTDRLEALETTVENYLGTKIVREEQKQLQ